MKRKRRDIDNPAARVWDALADGVAEAGGEAMAGEIRRAGEDPDALAEEARGILSKAVGRHRMAAAREERGAKILAMEKRKQGLPRSTSARRRLLERIFHLDSDLLQVALTLQFREVSDLPDDDVESALEQLSALGVLSDFHALDPDAGGDDGEPE